jgi:hypothetical protein
MLLLVALVVLIYLAIKGKLGNVASALSVLKK